MSQGERTDPVPQATTGESLLPLVYDALRAVARRRMAHLAPGQTLQPTALVHEAYLRLTDRRSEPWDHRGHFFAAAGRAMHDIVVEQVRRKSALKRGGDRQRAEFDGLLAITAPDDDILDVHEAVEELDRTDPRKAAVINLRYFVGLTVPETAEALDVSIGTIEREWRYIKAWLHQRLHPSEPGKDGG